MKTIKSDQDYAAVIAAGWAVLMDTTFRPSQKNHYEAKFAEALHTAMGYRREHLDELAF